MGFEVFLQSYADEKATGISRSAMLAAFGVWLSEESATLWRINYGSGNDCYVYVNEDADGVTGAMVSRPVADGRLWDALFNIMELGNIVVFWPGGKAPLVANASVIPHLPKGIVESLGTPFCIQSGRDILGRIKSD
ncbi:MAG TPA: hypothetical protein VG269_06940 [Tepidisphaeraceae bacterium]|jgi:hypothetical protein|nr:hypothetical protein [Tepidisphaeraceae bacterium]